LSENGRADEVVRAAELIYGRVLEEYPAPPAREAESNGNGVPHASRVRLTQVRSEVARTLDLYGDLLARAFDTYADLAQAALQPDTDPAPDTPLALAAAAGAEARVSVWLHNLSGAAVTGVELFMTDLTAASGRRLRAARATFAPARLDLDPGVSAAVELRVAVPATAAPGRYHGHVLAAALPASALAVRLVVEP